MHTSQVFCPLLAPMLALCLAGCAEKPGKFAAAPGPVVAMNTPAGMGSTAPNLTRATDGRVFLSWFEPAPDGGQALRFSVRDADGADWSAPQTILAREDFAVNWADFPSLLPLDGSALVAHFPLAAEHHSTSVNVVWSADGEQWTSPMLLHPDRLVGEQGFASLLPWQDGLIAAAWIDEGRGLSEPTQASLQLATLGTEQIHRAPALDERVCDCCQTSAAMTSAGPVLVYRDRSPDEVRDIAIVRYQDGAWTTPAAVAEDGWIIAGCPVNGPAVDANGRTVAVAWFTAAGQQPRVRIAFSADAGATFAAAIRADEGNPEGRVSVQLLADGSALLAWLERVQSGAHILMRRIGADGSMSAATVVAVTSPARNSGFPRMTVSGGRAFFAWTDVSGPQLQVKLATAEITP